jgi:ferredoxin
MPRVEVAGYGVFDVPTGTRLVNGLEANGVDILHRCGGRARCTSCRVVFSAGEPEQMTRAEYTKLDLLELHGQFRLSCQILVDRDMALRALQTLRASDATDPGPTPAPELTPTPEWIVPDALATEEDSRA